MSHSRGIGRFQFLRNSILFRGKKQRFGAKDSQMAAYYSTMGRTVRNNKEILVLIIDYRTKFTKNLLRVS